MAISFITSYDRGLAALLYVKFRSIFNFPESSDILTDINRSVIQVPREIALREIAEKRNQHFLEFINFWRTTTDPALERQRTAVARTGMILRQEDTMAGMEAKAQPVNLSYNVWFWSKNLDRINAAMEEYIFWQQENPQMSLMYNDLYEIEPDLHFGDTADESTIAEKYSRGIIFVYRVPIRIDGWIIKGKTFNIITSIKLTIYDKDGLEEIVIEDFDKNIELADQLRLATITINAV